MEFRQLNGQALAEARMNIFRTKLIGYNIDSVVDEFKGQYEAIMNGLYEGELVNNRKSREIIKKCKELVSTYVFPYSEILKLEIMGKNIIHDLMNMFWDGIKFYPYDAVEEGVKRNKKYPMNYKAYNLLSENYKTVFEHAYKGALDSKSKNYAKLQFLGDYICGMTDTFARELHKKLRNG